jgi:hypothetical protein
MITKSELQKANEELKAESRLKLGDSPTEELLAYSRGELAPADEERIREFLVANPDYARAIAEPFPAEGAERGDPDYLSGADFASRWAALQRRINGPSDVVRFHRRVELALAALLVLAFAGVLFQMQANRHLAGQLAMPRPWSEPQTLLPDGRRGLDDGAAKLVANGDGLYPVVLPLIAQDPYARYRVEIRDTTANPPRMLWSNDSLQRLPDDSITLLIPSEFLTAGHRYQLLVSGIDGNRVEPLASYTVRAAR